MNYYIFYGLVILSMTIIISSSILYYDQSPINITQPRTCTLHVLQQKINNTIGFNLKSSNENCYELQKGCLSLNCTYADRINECWCFIK